MTPRATDFLSHDPLLHRIWEHMGQPVRCRVVGGWIRDRLLGRQAGDLDLTIEGDAETAANPARRLAASLGTRAHLLGTAPHRVWRIESRAIKIELWPMGALTHREDMMRRDFSCNALSLELPDGPLDDLVGGLADLEARRLRAISRANLEDDPVRLLRAPRFLAQLEGFSLEDRSRQWIQDLAPRLESSPRERVGQELASMLESAVPSRGFQECLELDLFNPAAPAGATLDPEWLQANLAALDRLRGPDVSPATHRSRDPGHTARLAFLFRAWGIPTSGRLAPYSWPKADREIALRAARLLDEALSTVAAPAADRRELAWRAGTAFPTLLALATAVGNSGPEWRRWRRQWQRNPQALTNPRSLLSGDEIAEITASEPGPELGAIVNRFLCAQVRGEFRTEAGARRWLKSSRVSQLSYLQKA